MTFTATEQECLMHRLQLFIDQPDEYVEVLDAPAGDIEAAAVCVKAFVEGTAPMLMWRLGREILADCVEGSGWATSIEADGSPQAVAAANRTLGRLADKLSIIIRREVQAP